MTVLVSLIVGGVLGWFTHKNRQAIGEIIENLIYRFKN